MDHLAGFTNDTRIRVISADKDPRLRFHRATNSHQQPPEDNEENFPSLPTSGTQHRVTGSILSSGKLTYSTALVQCFRQFGQLPVEIRELIWEARMRADDKLNPSLDGTISRQWVFREADARNPRFLPRLCYVSKSMRDEITGVYMRNSIFVIPSIAGNTFFGEFIASVKMGSSHVRQLFFPNFNFFPDFDSRTGQRIPTNSDLELAVDCLGLRKVGMTFGRRHFQKEGTDHDSGVQVMRLLSVEELVEKYRLRRLLDCMYLRKVHLDGKYYTSAPPKVLRDLADWLEAEFASKNHHIKCEVTWRP
jgi:hypothetical protein